MKSDRGSRFSAIMAWTSSLVLRKDWAVPRRSPMSARASPALSSTARAMPLADDSAGRLEPLSITRVHAPSWPGDKKLRTCTDLHSDGERLWLSAAVDHDRFDSFVYELPGAAPAAELEAELRWRVPGFKVEGLAPALGSGGGLTIATDEDDGGGSIRRLSPERR